MRERTITNIIFLILYIITLGYITYELITKEMYFYLVILSLCIFANIYLAYMKYQTKKEIKKIANSFKIDKL